MAYLHATHPPACEPPVPALPGSIWLSKAPLKFPAGLSFEMPTDPSPALDHWKARWAEHPTLDWVREIFRKHRGSWQER